MIWTPGRPNLKIAKNMVGLPPGLMTMVSGSTWTAWTSQWGDLTKLLPGQGTNQAYLCWDEGALAGTGVATGCQNGCDDGDPCTIDSCVV